MDMRRAPTADSTPGKQQSYVRLSGRWPWVMQGIWVALAAFLLYAFVTTLPHVAAQMRTPCQPGACPWLQFTAPQMAAISHDLLPYDTYIAVILALGTASLVVMWSVSALIIWRRPDDWMAVLVAYSMLIQGTTLTTTSVPVGATPWLNPNAYILALVTLSAATVFALFPNGRFVPRWTRWLVIVNLILAIPLEIPGILPKTMIYTPLGPLGWVMTAIELSALACAQIYRYRAVSTPLERQQTKWALVGFATPVALVVAFISAASLAAALGAPTALVTLLSSNGGFVLPFGLAMGFGFAMLRSRLWEIDRLINRALVYGALTLVLSSLYIGLVIGLQTLARGVTGQDYQNNSLVIVLSTLVIAGLVAPLRRWIQAFIDRRFYRSRYDAARTLEAFSAGLRQEIQVEALREQLLSAVSETMHPAHVSLWLRPAPDRTERARSDSGPVQTPGVSGAPHRVGQSGA
jgi:hypothetical protein